MTSALLLLTYAVVAGTWGANQLRIAAWPNTAPRLAIAAWQALAASVLLALSASGLALAGTLPHVSDDLAKLVDLCASNLQHGYESPTSAISAYFGVAVFLSIFVRTAWCSIRAARGDRRERNARVTVLDLVGRPDVLPGALVLDHAAPYAFCIGGRRHRVVVTRGLLATLGDRELAAVLAHESAHLRQRHHIALLVCRALFGTLAPVFPAFRRAMPAARLYAELSADDCARKRVGTHALRSALATLACGPAPSGALAATANDVETRLRRLSGRRRRIGLVGSAAAGMGIAVAVLVPLALAAAPAITMAWKGICYIA